MAASARLNSAFETHSGRCLNHPHASLIAHTREHPKIDRIACPWLIPHASLIAPTREHPKIDRIACPWLIRRFIDPNAEFTYVPTSRVLGVAMEVGGTPYDIEGVEFSHEGDRSSFDI